MKTYGITVRKLNCHIFSSLTLFFSWDSRTAVLIFSISLSLSLRACLNCCSSPSFPCKARTFSSAATYNYDQTNKKHQFDDFCAEMQRTCTYLDGRSFVCILLNWANEELATRKSKRCFHLVIFKAQLSMINSKSRMQ